MDSGNPHPTPNRYDPYHGSVILLDKTVSGLHPRMPISTGMPSSLRRRHSSLWSFPRCLGHRSSHRRASWQGSLVRHLNLIIRPPRRARNNGWALVIVLDMWSAGRYMVDFQIDAVLIWLHLHQARYQDVEGQMCFWSSLKLLSVTQLGHGFHSLYIHKKHSTATPMGVVHVARVV